MTKLTGAVIAQYVPSQEDQYKDFHPITTLLVDKFPNRIACRVHCSFRDFPRNNAEYRFSFCVFKPNGDLFDQGDLGLIPLECPDGLPNEFLSREIWLTFNGMPVETSGIYKVVLFVDGSPVGTVEIPVCELAKPQTKSEPRKGKRKAKSSLKTDSQTLDATETDLPQ